MTATLNLNLTLSEVLPALDDDPRFWPEDEWGDAPILDLAPVYRVIQTGVEDYAVGDFRGGLLVDKDGGWRTESIARQAAALYAAEPWLFGEDRTTVLAELCEWERG